jgi:hypothetical protein
MICTTMPGPQQEKIQLQPLRAIDVSAIRVRASQGIFHPLRSICEAHKTLLSEAQQPEAYWRVPQETILDCVYATTRCCGCSAVARESPGVSGCVRMFVPPSQGVKLNPVPVVSRPLPWNLLGLWPPLPCLALCGLPALRFKLLGLGNFDARERDEGFKVCL